MVYLTGDTHRGFGRVMGFCERQNTTTEDVLIILGDAGINYYGDSCDDHLKYALSRLPITLFCVHGNHERRPSQDMGYTISQFHGGAAYVQNQYPNLVFAMDGQVYNFAGNQCIVCGGAYSVDKYYRLAHGLSWFPDEQPDDAARESVQNRLAALNYKVDIFLSHTCPFRYRPVEAFLSGMDESAIDTSTEHWLESIEKCLQYKKWYCGHYHIEKNIDKIRFLYRDIVELPSNENQDENVGNKEE